MHLLDAQASLKSPSLSIRSPAELVWLSIALFLFSVLSSLEYQVPVCRLTGIFQIQRAANKGQDNYEPHLKFQTK